MTKRERMLATLRHEGGIIPVWSMAFENIETARRILGDDNTPTDIHPGPAYRPGAATPENRARNLRYAEAMDNYVIGVGRGGSFSFGHRGPGEFMERVLERDDRHIVAEHETGVKKETRFSPHFFHYYDYPAMTREAFERMTFPDAGAPERYLGIAEEARFYRKQGYYTYASVNGFFSGLHYFLCPYDELLAQLLLDEDFIDAMLAKLGDFNLTAAENLLRAGVDCITFCDDLGSGSSLLFSPELYDRYFFPWHKALADLCHSYGAHLHMHSHGDIRKVLGRIVDTGVDMLNPCDPYENMDMAALKEAYGHRVTFVGGVHKFFFEWSEDEMEAALRALFTVGGKGGGYIFMDSSGSIPETVSAETYAFYSRTSRRLRRALCEAGNGGAR